MRPSFQRRALAIAASCFVSAQVPARAQDAPAGALSYEDATHLAQGLAPDLRSARAKAEIANTGVGVARMWTNPQASIGTSSDGARFSSSLSIPLPFTRRGSVIGAAESSAAAATSELPLVALDARLAAANAWCDLWLAERSFEVAGGSEARAARVRAEAEQRFRDGAAPRLDAARATAEHARSRAESMARAELVADKSAVLAYWLGRNPAVVLHVSGQPPSPPALPPLEPLLARFVSHPLFARNTARARAAQGLVRMQKSQAWPTFGIQLGAALWNRSAPQNNFSASLVFDLPVFNWNRPGIAMAEDGAAQVAAESDAATSRLRADLVSAYAALKAAIARATAAENDVLPASQLAADLTRDAYQTGAVDLSAVLVSEKLLAEARQGALDAVSQRGRSLATLEHAIGGPL